jgi:hypothetical protein
VPQRHDHHTAVAHQNCYAGHCLSALQPVEMHPNGRQHDHGKLFIACSHDGQVRQAVVKPFDDR